MTLPPCCAAADGEWGKSFFAEGLTCSFLSHSFTNILLPLSYCFFFLCLRCGLLETIQGGEKCAPEKVKKNAPSFFLFCFFALFDTA